jgi:hypothetical protein
MVFVFIILFFKRTQIQYRIKSNLSPSGWQWVETQALLKLGSVVDNSPQHIVCITRVIDEDAVHPHLRSAVAYVQIAVGESLMAMAV